MRPIEDVSGVTPSEAENLRSLGYPDLESLWHAIDTPNAIAAVVNRTGVERVRLATLLASSEIAESRRLTSTWPDHVSGLFMQVVWTAIVTTAILGVVGIVGLGVKGAASQRPERTFAVVTAPGISAFQLVSNQHFATRKGPHTAQDLAAPGSIIGRYMLRSLTEGSEIRTSDVSSRALPSGALNGRRIVVLTIPAANSPNLSPPESVTLIFSPVPTAPMLAAENIDGLVLNVRIVGDRSALDVAVLASDLPRLGRVAGQSSVIVAAER